MTAMMVTPEIVRVFFLRRTGRSLSFSLGFRAFIISALERMCSRWCLAAIWVFSRFKSSWLGDGKSIRALIISRAASLVFKVEIPH